MYSRGDRGESYFFVVMMYDVQAVTARYFYVWYVTRSLGDGLCHEK